MSYTISNIGNSIKVLLEMNSDLRKLCIDRFNEYIERVNERPFNCEQHVKDGSVVKFNLKQDFVVDPTTKFIVCAILESSNDISIIVGIQPHNIENEFALIDYSVECYGIYSNRAYKVIGASDDLLRSASKNYEVFYGQDGLNIRLLKVKTSVPEDSKDSNNVIISKSSYTRSYLMSPAGVEGNNLIYKLVVYYAGVYIPSNLHFQSVAGNMTMTHKFPDVSDTLDNIEYNQIVSLIFTKQGPPKKVEKKVEPVEIMPKIIEYIEEPAKLNDEDHKARVERVKKDSHEFYRKLHPDYRLKMHADSWSFGQQLTLEEAAEYKKVMVRDINDRDIIDDHLDQPIPYSKNVDDMYKDVFTRAVNDPEPFLNEIMKNEDVANKLLLAANELTCNHGVSYGYYSVKPIKESREEKVQGLSLYER